MVKRMIDEKHERHDLAFEKFQRARDDGNEDITKRLLFLGILNKWEMADKKNAAVKYRGTHSPLWKSFKKSYENNCLGLWTLKSLKSLKKCQQLG